MKNNNTNPAVTIATVTNPQTIEAAKRRLDPDRFFGKNRPDPVVIRFGLN